MTFLYDIMLYDLMFSPTAVFGKGRCGSPPGVMMADTLSFNAKIGVVEYNLTTRDSPKWTLESGPSIREHRGSGPEKQ